MNMPPFEPLHIPEINIIQGKESNIAIELQLTDVDLYGISTAVVSKAMWVALTEDWLWFFLWSIVQVTEASSRRNVSLTSQVLIDKPNKEFKI